MTMIALWDIVPCSVAEVDRRFRDTYASIIRAMMEAVRISETSVYFSENTRHCITEGCNLGDIVNQD
jgi:hypothetical protein